MNTRPAPWSVQYDTNYKAYYYFNSVTGESEWIEDETDKVHLDNENDKVEIELTNLAHSLSSGSGMSKRMLAKNDDSDDEDDTDANQTNDDGIALITDSARVYADTEAAMASQKRCLFINACLCESPLAVIEGIVRSTGFMAFSIIFLIVALATRSWEWVEVAWKCFREAVLTLAAVVSLLIPCMACFVYRRYDGDEDWDLAPLPTILGWVDTQRFLIFSLGGGSTAQRRPRGSDESIFSQRTALFDFHDAHSEDSWKEGGILMSPRRVLSSLGRVANGDVDLEDVELGERSAVLQSDGS